MTKEHRAGRGDEFRIMCPDCKTTWSTLEVPAECPDCAATVTFRVTKRVKSSDGQSGDRK